MIILYINDLRPLKQSKVPIPWFQWEDSVKFRDYSAKLARKEIIHFLDICGETIN